MFKKYFPYIIVILLGFIFLFLVKPNSLGISHDSVYYLEMAQDILGGDKIELTTPEYNSLWPAVYPALLCLFSIVFDETILNSAIYLNFVSIIFLGFLFIEILKEFEASYFQVLLLPLILLVSTPLTISRMLWSELIFFVVLLASILSIVKFINYGKLKYLIYCGLLGGLSFFIKFSAAGFIIGMLFFLIFFNKEKKLKALAVYLLSIMIIYFLGTYFSILIGQHPAGRPVDVRMIKPYKMLQSVFVFIKWFVKKGSLLSLFLGIAFFTLLIFQLVFQIPNLKKMFKLYSAYILLFLTLIIVYYSFLIGVIIVFDNGINLSNRMLAPIFILSLLLFSLVLKNVFNKKYLSQLMLCLLLICSSFSSYGLWENHYIEGKGYTAKKLNKYSDFLDKIIKENPDISIYSNAYDFISYLSGNRAYLIPLREKEKAYNQSVSVSDLKFKIQSGTAFLLFSNSFEGRSAFMGKEDILNDFKDCSIEFFFDGFIVRK